jgi:hypothetical protein
MKGKLSPVPIPASCTFYLYIHLSLILYAVGILIGSGAVAIGADENSEKRNVPIDEHVDTWRRPLS